MKKMKTSKGVWASRMLLFSGLFQMIVITTHINMITGLYSTIIGFYMFAFVLFTIINILNGVNYAAKKSVATLVTTYIVSLVQMGFAFLFVKETLNEVALYPEITITKNMMTSLSFVGVSVGLTVLALVLATLYNFKKDQDISIYF
ncbi:hypothetical protein [Fusibacter sp. 3D3]|uniref:hypothetical protein n=1 Tax=Fusibacter sp. 3D3 TaxID=1048380 RepID=UPI0008530720|nr:hypothetical protein [Fusibacter sp. 3D3]GAU75742.1 hypothetical protein F3D3_0333 [Fusibacter sp. 3D3]